MDKQFRERFEFLESLQTVLTFVSEPSKLKKILTEYEIAEYKSLIKYGIDDAVAMEQLCWDVEHSLEMTQDFRRELKAN